MHMGQKGMDFKHKEVINIKDGKRLRLCARCMCWFRKWNNYIYNGCKIENRYMKIEFERNIVRNSYATLNNQNRTGYVIREKFEYDVVCKVEL